MLGPELGKKLTDALSAIGLLQLLANPLGGVRSSRDVKQSLIGSGILHDVCGLAFDGQNHRRLLFLSCFMKSPDRRRKIVSDWMSLVISVRRICVKIY